MKIKILGLLALLTLGCSGMVVGQAITLDHSDGTVDEDGTGLALTGQEIIFHIRMAAGPVGNQGITGGFRVYSDDGATWDTTVIDTTGVIGRAQFDLLWGIASKSTNGTVSDTVGFNGSVMFNPFGMPADFSDVTHTITIGPIDVSEEGKTVCLDSCFMPPASLWKWVTAPGDVIPSWDGPHCYIIDADGTDVGRLSDLLPTEWSLGQNYPNPFNPTTEIAFDVPSQSHVTLAVYNVLGQHVADLVDGNLSAGHYTADWDGTSQGGSSVASGVYFYRLETENYIETKKMMLLK